MSGNRNNAGTSSVKEWEGLSKLGGEMLIDTGAANEKYRQQQNTNERIKEGIFRAPRNVSRAVLERGVHESIKRFISMMGKQGWELTSRVELTGPFTARAPDSSVVLLDMAEFKVRGVFKFVNKVEQRRIYLPPEAVKQDPEHSIRAGGPHDSLARLVKEQ